MRSSFLDATVTNRECNVEMGQVNAVTNIKYIMIKPAFSWNEGLLNNLNNFGVTKENDQ